jgi:hypothetical protein
MKENIGDEVFAEMKQILSDTRTYLAKEFKNVRPFNSRKMTSEEQLAEWDAFNQSPDAQQRMGNYIEEFGPEYVNKFIEEMETMRFNKGRF